MTREVVQTDLFLVYYQGPLVGLCVLGYKFPCAAVTICASLLNIQTRTEHLTSSSAMAERPCEVGDLKGAGH